jgi:hypothetical protein
MLRSGLKVLRRQRDLFPQYLNTSATKRFAFSSGSAAPKQPHNQQQLAGYRFKKRDEDNGKKYLLIKAGVPFVLFCVLASWVVSNAFDGKLKELEASQGKASKSLRQAKMEEEHEDMMDRLGKIVSEDFDNTKRIKRPHEILEERRKERERRNAWHRRAWRFVAGSSEDERS